MQVSAREIFSGTLGIIGSVSQGRYNYISVNGEEIYQKVPTISCLERPQPDISWVFGI